MFWAATVWKTQDWSEKENSIPQEESDWPLMRANTLINSNVFAIIIRVIIKYAKWVGTKWMKSINAEETII